VMSWMLSDIMIPFYLLQENVWQFLAIALLKKHVRNHMENIKNCSTKQSEEKKVITVKKNEAWKKARLRARQDNVSN